MRVKLLLSVSALVLLGAGCQLLPGKTGKDRGSVKMSERQMAQGFLTWFLDFNEGWQLLDELGLNKKHGVSHPDSPCPDFFAPLILQFPDGLESLPSNLAINPTNTPWLSLWPQINIPQDGRPLLPDSVPPLPEGNFSDPFFINFNCNIPNTNTQELNGSLNITIYNADDTMYRPAFDIPVRVDVFAQGAYPTDDGFFMDGFEGLPQTCVNPGTPDEDCWNLIVFP